MCHVISNKVCSEALNVEEHRETQSLEGDCSEETQTMSPKRRIYQEEDELLLVELTAVQAVANCGYRIFLRSWAALRTVSNIIMRTLSRIVFVFRF